MRKTDKLLVRLIELNRLIRSKTGGPSKGRDDHFEISWTFNNGDPYWYIQHDGYHWNIEDVLTHSQNQFTDVNDAVKKFKEVLYNVNNSEIDWIEDKRDNELSMKDKDELEQYKQELYHVGRQL